MVIISRCFPSLMTCFRISKIPLSLIWTWWLCTSLPFEFFALPFLFVTKLLDFAFWRWGVEFLAQILTRSREKYEALSNWISALYPWKLTTTSKSQPCVEWTNSTILPYLRSLSSINCVHIPELRFTRKCNFGCFSKTCWMNGVFRLCGI